MKLYDFYGFIKQSYVHLVSYIQYFILETDFRTAPFPKEFYKDLQSRDSKNDEHSGDIGNFCYFGNFK